MPVSDASLPPKRMVTDRLRSYGAAKRQVIAGHRASFSQRLEQSGGEFACSVSKTGANAARLSIDWKLAAFRFARLCRSQSLRSIPYRSLSISDPKSPLACHGRMESSERPGCLKRALAISHAYTSNNVTAPVEDMIGSNSSAFSAGALLYIDADHFKTINDRFGHAVGDDVLQEMGTLVRGTLGRRDVGARFGGQEFAIFLADADYGKAAWIANRVLVDVRALSRKFASEEMSVTVSIGVAFHEPGQTLEQVVNAAHERVHQAKQQGRNRIAYAASA